MRANLLLLCLIAVTPGCSSSSSSGGSTSDATTDSTTDGGSTSDATTDSTSDGGSVDPLNCVPPGTKPNEKGMGGYCSPGGGECLYAGPDGGARICTADVPDTPTHAWFCTFPCNLDGDCGTDAYCATDPKSKQKGCVPNVCKSLQGDAGTDTGSDASSDSSSDAPTD